MRERWLNTNHSTDLTIQELTEKLGAYTVEAMQCIDNENARRMAIVSSVNTSKAEKTAALQSGVWYSKDYLIHVKEYEDRFQWMLNEDVLKNGFLSKKFWQPVVSEDFPKSRKPYAYLWNNAGSSPAEEIVNILEGKSLCLLECATVFNIAQYAAILRIVGKDKFNRIFSGKEKFTLPLRISNMGEINPIYLFLEGKTINNISAIRIGDKLSIRNHSDYQKKHYPNGAARGWNIVCAEVDPEIKFQGFGFGKNLTITEITQLLIDEYNKPLFDPLIWPQTPKQRSSVATSITIKDFVSNPGAGLSLQVVTLDPKKVKMILDADVHSVNLLDIFNTTSETALSYAMEFTTLGQWKNQTQSASTNKFSMNMQ